MPCRLARLKTKMDCRVFAVEKDKKPMLRSVVRTVEQLLVHFRWPGPPPALAVCAIGSENAPTSAPYDINRILQDFGIVFGVPKSRTSRQRKQTRKFSYNKLLPTNSNLISCQQCGGLHEIHTICGKCYSTVRELTNAIKEKMMNYDPYQGEMPDKELVVLFDDEEEDKIENAHDKRVIKLSRERPPWFTKDLLRKWEK